MDRAVVVTGGAGFLGSHLVDALQQRKEDVIVVDNLASGRMENLHEASGKGRLRFIKMDLKASQGLVEILESASVIFHFAANPEVRA